MMDFWNVVRSAGRIYAEHVVTDTFTYEVDVTAILGSANPEYEYAHIQDKRWAGEYGASKLKEIVEKIKRGQA